jgi:AcrR family transcriptional regulator
VSSAEASSADPGAGATAGTRRRRRQQRARREEVLDVAARMFYERGYAATTTQEIGAALGLLKGSVYYYISSKQDLLYELIAQYHDDTREHFERIVASEAEPLDKVRALIAADAAHVADNIERSSLFHTEWRVLPPERQQPILDERRRHEVAVAEWLTAGQAAGTVRPEVDARVAALGIFGMVNSVSRWFRPDGRKSGAQIGEEFADLLVGGLAVPTAG